MKKLLSIAVTLFAVAPVFAQVSPAQTAKLEKIVREALPVCEDLQLTSSELNRKLPAGMTGVVFSAKSKSGYCDGDQVAITTMSGSVWVGGPWFLDGEGTPQKRIEAYAWEALREHLVPEFGTERTRDGLIPVTLWESTARGKVPLKGAMDEAGRVFFLGEFRPMNADFRASRLKTFEPILASSPAMGAEKPEVTIIEFSDFECPSCKRHSEDAKKIVAAHPDKVRYIRYDLPLVSMHPWALTATMAGRAIYRQKPERFWDYKALIYENQDKLNAFAIDDFVSGFATDIELDMDKFRADASSEELRNEVLRGVGLAFANDIHSTPTYMVNGAIVDAGEGGKLLSDYVEALLQKR